MLEYATKLLINVVDQRLKVLQYFQVVYAAFLYAEYRLLSLMIAIVNYFMTWCFWRLEERSTQLVNNKKNALRMLEERLGDLRIQEDPKEKKSNPTFEKEIRKIFLSMGFMQASVLVWIIWKLM